MVVFLPWAVLSSGTCILLALLTGSFFLLPLSTPSFQLHVIRHITPYTELFSYQPIPNSFCSIFHWCQFLAHYHSLQYYSCVNSWLSVISTLKNFPIPWLINSPLTSPPMILPFTHLSHPCQWVNPRPGLNQQLHLLHNLSAMPYFWSPHNLPSDFLRLHSPTTLWPHAQCFYPLTVQPTNLLFLHPKPTFLSRFIATSFYTLLTPLHFCGFTVLTCNTDTEAKSNFHFLCQWLERTTSMLVFQLPSHIKMMTTTLAYRRVNIADLRLLSLERPAGKASPWPVFGNLNFRRGSHHSLIRMAHWASSICASNMVYSELLVSFWKPEILVCATQKVPTWPAHSKTPGNESLMTFLGRQHFTCAVTTGCSTNENVLCNSTGKCSYKFIPGILWTGPHLSFPQLILLCAFCYNKSQC